MGNKTNYLEIASILIKKHEGLRLFPYLCPSSRYTIGYGRNLEDKGISRSEANFLLKNDIIAADWELQRTMTIFSELCEARKAVLIDMVFNMGLSRFMGFRKFREALITRNFNQAAEEMIDSLWFRQVGYRAERLAQIMRHGEIISS